MSCIRQKTERAGSTPQWINNPTTNLGPVTKGADALCWSLFVFGFIHYVTGVWSSSHSPRGL